MRSDRERLEDVLEASRTIREQVADRVETLPTDEILRLATERLIEIVGEAASNLSPELRAGHPDVDWRGPRGLRTILAHRYFGIDVAAIQDVVRHELPEFERRVTAILAELD